jgi:hypothetical protein
MENSKPIPTSLKVVAVLFILGGISSLIEVVVSLIHNHININFGVLGIFIGRGLLSLSRDWRTCALVFLWIAMIGVPIVAIFFLTTSGPVDFTVFGQKVGDVPKEFGITIAVLAFALAVWQYWVLTRPAVRRLFGVASAEPPTAADGGRDAGSSE